MNDVERGEEYMLASDHRTLAGTEFPKGSTVKVLHGDGQTILVQATSGPSVGGEILLHPDDLVPLECLDCGGELAYYDERSAWECPWCREALAW